MVCTVDHLTLLHFVAMVTSHWKNKGDKGLTAGYCQPGNHKSD